MPCSAVIREAASYGNRDPQSHFTQRVSDFGKALERKSPSNPSCQGSGNSEEEKAEYKKPEGVEDRKESRPSRYNRAQRLWQHAQGLHGSAPDGT